VGCWATYPLEVYTNHVRLCSRRHDKIYENCYGSSSTEKKGETPQNTQSQIIDLSPNCVIPISFHDVSKGGRPAVKSTEVSVVIQVGSNQAKVCDLQHFRDAAFVHRICASFPLPHPETVDDNSDWKCDFKACELCPTVNDQISVFSASYPGQFAYKFCTLDCCVKMLAGISDPTFCRLLLEKGIKKETKKRKLESNSQQKPTKQARKGTKTTPALVVDDNND